MASNAAPAENTTQIRIGGVGGQGIVVAGKMLGKAAALFDGKEAVCTQSYGPEARGGASRADIIISDTPVDYPFVIQPDILAVLFQEAYTRFRSRLKPGGVLIIETDLVHPHEDEAQFIGLPATRIAKDLGNRLATNIVLLGYLVGATSVVSQKAMQDAIRDTVRKDLIDLDMRAFEAGFDLAQQERES